MNYLKKSLVEIYFAFCNLKISESLLFPILKINYIASLSKILRA